MWKELILLIAIILIILVMQSVQKKQKTGGGEKKKTALELGFGGKVTAPKGYKVTAVDMREFKQKDIKDFHEEGRKVKNVKSNMEEFCEGKYDLIKMNNSWHFVEDHVRMLNNLKKMLKPDGRIFISEPGKESRWHAPYLNKDSKEFRPLAFKYKMLQVNSGRSVLRVQNVFNVEEEQREDKGYNYKLTHP
jgi:2-polyprenyl-3-methyl-5-hydroxy-6-metoxy-1,4-benzoquinol methylase